MLGQFGKEEMDTLIAKAITRYRSLESVGVVAKEPKLMGKAAYYVNAAELSRCKTFCKVEKRNGRWQVFWAGDGRYKDTITPEIGLNNVQINIQLANFAMAEAQQKSAPEVAATQPEEDFFVGPSPTYQAPTPEPKLDPATTALLRMRDKPGTWAEEEEDPIDEIASKAVETTKSAFDWLFKESTSAEEKPVAFELKPGDPTPPDISLTKEEVRDYMAGKTVIIGDIQGRRADEQARVLSEQTVRRNTPVQVTSLNHAMELAKMILGPFVTAEHAALAEQIFAQSKTGRLVWLPPINARVLEEKQFNWPIFLFGAMAFMGIGYFVFKAGKKRRAPKVEVGFATEILKPIPRRITSSSRALPAPR
jgi:hypothetical protein